MEFTLNEVNVFRITKIDFSTLPSIYFITKLPHQPKRRKINNKIKKIKICQYTIGTSS